MAEIRPFHAIHFDPERVEVDRALAPPYHEVTEDLYEDLIQKEEYNIVQLIAGFESGWYTRAQQTLHRWQEREILVRETEPALYVLHQTYRRNGRSITRKGFIGLIALRGNDGAELPCYYQTRIQRRDDRFRLISSTGSYAQQIVCGFRDDKSSLDSLLVYSAHDDPWMQFTFDGVEFRIWKVTNEATIHHTIHFFTQIPVTILQGKHLYDAAIRATEGRDQDSGGYDDAHQFIPAYFCNTNDGTTIVRPVHRAIRLGGSLTRETILAKIYKHFNLHQFSREEGLEALHRDGPHVFLLAFPGVPSCTYAKLKNTQLLGVLLETLTSEFERSFDVNILHRYLFERIFEMPHDDQIYSDDIHFSRREDEIFSIVHSSRSVGVFMRAPVLDALVEAAERSIRLQYPTADLYPSLPSGLFLYSIL